MKKRYSDFVWDDRIYCDIEKDILSHNYVCNIILGQRELGKTSAVLVLFMLDALKSIEGEICNKRFIWMRLSERVINKIKPNFFGDFLKLVKKAPNSKYKELKELLKDKELIINGDYIFVKIGKKKINIGEFMALSSYTQRSLGCYNIHNVHYDEFVNEGRKYFDEFAALQYLIDTTRQKAGSRVILSANNITNNHPLFSVLNIVKVEEGYTKINQDENRWILILRYPENKKLSKKRSKTLTGFLGSLNTYNEMANSNETFDDYEGIGEVNWKYISPYFSLSTGNKILYFYWYGTKLYICSKEHKGPIYTLNNSGLNSFYIDEKNKKPLKDFLLKKNYRGDLIFENLQCKTLFYKCLTL